MNGAVIAGADSRFIARSLGLACLLFSWTLFAWCRAADVAEDSGGAPEQSSEGEKKPWLDRLHEGFATGVDGAARWVDGFFGEEKTDFQARGAHGRFSVRMIWKEYEDFRVRTRLRAYLPLDNMRQRAYAFIGRGDAEQIIEDANAYDGLLDTDNDNDWLAGLGYAPPWSKSGRISLSAGVKVDWPPDPYVRVTYKWQHEFNEKSLFRLRESLYWQESEDFGSSTAIDLERRIGKNHLIRWASWGRISGETNDLRYDSRIMLYRRISENRAIMYACGFRGETGDPEPAREYGIYAVYRQRAWRDWLFGEIILGGTNFREDTWSERKLSLIVGLGFEMVFDKRAPEGEPGVGAWLQRGLQTW